MKKALLGKFVNDSSNHDRVTEKKDFKNYFSVSIPMLCYSLL